jgi:hypothetical protein
MKDRETALQAAGIRSVNLLVLLTVYGIFRSVAV